MPLKNIRFFHQKTPRVAMLLLGILSLNTVSAGSVSDKTPGSTTEKTALQNNCSSALLQAAGQRLMPWYRPQGGRA